MCGRCERPFFVWFAQFQERQAARLTYGTGAHDAMHWSDARVIAYIITCARVLLM